MFLCGNVADFLGNYEVFKVININFQTVMALSNQTIMMSTSVSHKRNVNIIFVYVYLFWYYFEVFYNFTLVEKVIFE